MMNMKDRLPVQKELVIKKLQDMLKEQAVSIRESSKITTQEKVEQMDVILDLKHYLEHYDEYSRVIEKYRMQQETVISDR